METKMITIPFNAGLAKKIQEGNYPGSIITRNGNDVRIICWDLQKDHFPIIAVITTDGDEDVYYRTIGGRSSVDNEEEGSDDLVLLVPEWTQFKDGDILACETHNGPNDYYKWFSILKGEVGLMLDNISFRSYVSYDHDSSYHAGKLTYDEHADNIDSIRLATEEEKQKLIDALKTSTDPLAREYLKRFFGIEEEGKQECEFEFLQPVLVRDGEGDSWKYGEFTFERKGLYYINGGISWVSCIPYNEQTKHLLGTTDNWEE